MVRILGNWEGMARIEHTTVKPELQAKRPKPPNDQSPPEKPAPPRCPEQ